MSGEKRDVVGLYEDTDAIIAGLEEVKLRLLKAGGPEGAMWAVYLGGRGAGEPEGHVRGPQGTGEGKGVTDHCMECFQSLRCRKTGEREPCDAYVANMAETAKRLQAWAAKKSGEDMIGREATVDRGHTVNELRLRAEDPRPGNMASLKSYKAIYFADLPVGMGACFTEKEVRIALLLAADAIEAGDFPALGDW